jgi:hypothetical protein
MKKILSLILALHSAQAFSWVENQNVTIQELIMWEGADTGVTGFKLSNGVWCYIPGSQKNLHSLILTAYAAGNKAHVYCYDAADPMAGGSVPPAHRLHRITVVKN